jgi:NADH-quinone oxidoreductase subunit F
MNIPSNEEIFSRCVKEPAPLLPALHALHSRDGYLSEESILATSLALKIPLADLYGTVTFYHHFSRAPGGLAAPRVCTGTICRMRGAKSLLSLAGATEMPCAGRCDDPIPVLREDSSLVSDGQTLVSKPSPLPPPKRVGIEECVFRHLRAPGRATLAGYRATGGYLGLTRFVRESSPAALLKVIQESGLSGRGGAAFPTGRKWQAVADAPGNPKTIVCNADEGEPGCFKDRALLDYDPHAIIEGMLAAAFATGAARGFIYLRYEYPETERLLEKALAEARAAKLLGEKILESAFSFELYVRRGAGAYICGEETSLLNSLEGKHPFPRNRPPFPVTHGYENLPTVVNNVETLASVPHILVNGADWYRGLGRNGQAGTKLISLSGDISRPGNYEVPLGLPLEELLYQWAGGPLSGSIQAVTMAGLSGGFLAGADLSVTLDEPSIRSKGSFLGAGGIMVFDDTRDMVQVAYEAMSFFAHESCGKCFPCRIGTQRLAERLRGQSGPTESDAWHQEVRDLGRTMKELSACGLGMAAPLITESLVRYFPQQVAAHLKESQKGPRAF